jgi:UDP-4-amino-4-deoxy-L-arabinose formyltransferase/UDP-glucuronic acid dehydrogenase (UDP-4-keto-hexauronic acid decarboxylating)
LRILLVAEEAAGTRLLRELAKSEDEVIGVMTGESESPAAVAQLAKQLGISVFPSTAVLDPEQADFIRSQQVDLLLNVHSLFIIHADVLRAPRIGAFNLHPGLLPDYAGLNAPSWAIYNGERRHGVTVHWIEPEVDTGPIVYQAEFEIDERDTGLTLSAKCVREGLPLMLRLVEAARGGRDAIPARVQDRSCRRYFGREVPQDGVLDWRVPARRVADFVRAADFHPFPSPWGHPVSRLGDREVGVVKARRTGVRTILAPGTIGEAEEDGVRVACTDEWIVVQRLHLEGRYARPQGVLHAGGSFLAVDPEHFAKQQ